MPKIDLGKVVGEDAKITIGTTTTLDAGNDATVENVGTKSDAVLNFGIPKGYTPIKGTDYWTENDIDEIHDYVDEQISAIDLTPYSEKTETGHSIELSIDAQTYVMTATLKNVSGDVLNTQTIDLPLETMVVSGSYDSATKEVVLTLQSGSTIRFSVSDLVDGLVNESDLEVTLANYVSRETFDNVIGDLDDLSTEDKTTIVNAINEAFAKTSEAQVFNEETFDISVQPTGDYVLGSSVRHMSYPGVTSITTGWNGSIVRQVNIDGKNAYAIVITQSGDVRVIGKVNNTSRNIEATMLLTGAQNIRGEKTFMTMPKLHQNLTITDDQHIVNKKYVDDAINNSSENNIHYLGEIGQYTIDNPLNLNLLNKGVYVLTNTSRVTQYYISKEYNGNVTKTPITFSTNYWTGHTPIFLKMFTEINDELASDTTVCEFSVQEIYNNYAGGDARIIEIYAPVKLNAAVYWYGAAEIVPVTISNDQTVTGKKTFATLPETSVVPTSNNQMVNKKYVDDSIASAIGDINTVLATLTTVEEGE